MTVTAGGGVRDVEDGDSAYVSSTYDDDAALDDDIEGDVTVPIAGVTAAVGIAAHPVVPAIAIAVEGVGSRCDPLVPWLLVLRLLWWW